MLLDTTRLRGGPAIRLPARIVIGVVCAVASASFPLSRSADAAPGPALETPRPALDAAFGCDGPLSGLSESPVLLLHGGIATGGQWTGNYDDALAALGYRVCRLSFPRRALGDAQVSVEYAVHAIREIHRKSGRKLTVIGHSFGGFIQSIALRYWPDLGTMVEDAVGLAGVYENGTAAANLLCTASCPLVATQIRQGSKLARATGARPLLSGPDFTTVNAPNDQLIIPQPAAGHLAGARNVSIGDMCPGRYVDHLSIVLDAAAFALALDAMTHDGPADPRRARNACSRWLLPGVDPTGLGLELGRVLVGLGPFAEDGGRPEPPLRCYANSTCLKPRLLPSLVLEPVTPRAGHVIVSGSLELPTGALEQCRGRIVVHATRGGRALARGSGSLGLDCRFRARVAVTRRGMRATRIVAASAATTELLATRATRRIEPSRR